MDSGDHPTPQTVHRDAPRNHHSTTTSLLAVLICVHVGLLGYCGYAFSPTVNEPAHLVAGISYWRLQRFDLFRVNPPLVRMVAALPVMAFSDDPPWREPSNTHQLKTHTYVGRDFVSMNGERTLFLLMLARWACIPFSVLGCLVCFWWARDLYGPTAGLLAATLWCFDPNIVAHGSVITTDMAGTSLGLCACYTFWRWLRAPTWGRALLTGVILGLAELAKTTLVVLYPLWPVLWIGYRLIDGSRMQVRDWFREGAMLFVRMVIGIYVINLGYVFEGSMIELRQLQFRSELFTGKSTEEPGNRFADSWIGAMPVPLPKNYVLGIDEQRCDFEDYDRPSYLSGTWQKTGWWYYYCYALSLKVPLGTVGLLVVALLGKLVARTRISTIRDEVILLCPAAIIFAIVSAQSGFSEHLRYVLPIFPFLFVFAAHSVCVVNINRVTATCDHFSSKLRWTTDLVVTGLIGWAITSCLSTYPHCLAYFNEFAGGPREGHRYLLGSNIDWGQDLRYLKSYLDGQPDHDQVYLAYEGAVYPEDLGIRYVVPSSAPDDQAVGNLPPGLYAVSVTFLRGFLCMNRKKDDLGPAQLRYLTGLLDRKPIAMCGYSIYLYEISGKHSVEESGG